MMWMRAHMTDMNALSLDVDMYGSLISLMNDMNAR